MINNNYSCSIIGVDLKTPTCTPDVLEEFLRKIIHTTINEGVTTFYYGCHPNISLLAAEEILTLNLHRCRSKYSP